MKTLYLILGLLCVALGAIGVIVPGLPTTPFLLLALYLFGKSSARLTQWFIHTKLYQKHLKTFDETRSMTLTQKLTILAVAAPFCIFAFLTLPNFWGKLALVLAVMYQYYYFFFKIKTLKQ